MIPMENVSKKKKRSDNWKLRDNIFVKAHNSSTPPPLPPKKK